MVPSGELADGRLVCVADHLFVSLIIIIILIMMIIIIIIIILMMMMLMMMILNISICLATSRCFHFLWLLRWSVGG